MLGILLAATVAASPPPPPATAPAHTQLCPSARPQTTSSQDRVVPRKLGELPDAERYHAVWKEAGGCAIEEVWQNGRWVDRWGGPALPGLRPTRRSGR